MKQSVIMMELKIGRYLAHVFVINRTFGGRVAIIIIKNNFSYRSKINGRLPDIKNNVVAAAKSTAVYYCELSPRVLPFTVKIFDFEATQPWAEVTVNVTV